jgi:hypothetical protein
MQRSRLTLLAPKYNPAPWVRDARTETGGYAADVSPAGFSPAAVEKKSQIWTPLLRSAARKPQQTTPQACPRFNGMDASFFTASIVPEWKC